MKYLLSCLLVSIFSLQNFAFAELAKGATVVNSSESTVEPSSSQVICETIPKNAVLQKGVKDTKTKNVISLQNILYDSGYLKVLPNGYFGAGTYAAVRTFQKKYDLKVTGIVGPYTLAKLNQLKCKNGGMVETVKEVVTSSTSVKQIKSTVLPADSDSAINPNKPNIANFTFDTNSDGVQVYSTTIQNVDSLSLKAVCPAGIVEVKSGVGLTKVKIDTASSVCSKEKYLLLSDANKSTIFERSKSQMIFSDRDGVPSWFAFDSSSTPSTGSVQLMVKACLGSICVQKLVITETKDFFTKAVSSSLSLSDVHVDGKQNLFLNASNFNSLTVKAGCPYNIQAVDANGIVLTDEKTSCSQEKDIVAKQTKILSIFDKPEGTPLKSLGLVFELRPVNGQVDLFSNVELTVKACSGVQAETIASTTLKCVEKAAFLPVYKK